jgi:hypothetical protein
MSSAVENQDLVLELAEGESAGIALFAGGTTGLVLLDSTGGRRAFWMSLGERAEREGLSALGFAGPVPGDAEDAAVRAAHLLRRLGADQLVIAAAGADAAGALRAAGTGTFAALALVDPAIPDHELEPLLEETPMPKLVLVVESDAQAGAIYRHAIGPTVIRHLPTPDARREKELLAGERADLAEEAILGFTVGVCGDGRQA